MGEMNQGEAKSAHPIRSRMLVVLVVGFAVVLLLGYGFSSQGSAVGKVAPDFSLALFSGRQVSLGSLQASVVVVNFWASWCGPCREEADALEKVWREYRDKGVSFVGINLKDSQANARSFLEEFDITYPNGPDPYGRISRAYRVYGLPETFVIAREGRIVDRFIGAVTAEKLRASLDRALGG